MKTIATPSGAGHHARSGLKQLRGAWVALVVLVGANGYLTYEALTAEAVSSGGDLYPGVVRLEVGGASGSGVLVSESRLITAAHVAGDVGSTVTAHFPDGNVVTGRVVASGYSELAPFLSGSGGVASEGIEHDWAVVELDVAQDYSLALFLGQSSLAQAGEEVRAIGYPGGMELQNVSTGIVSAVPGGEIRTDAPIDPGYSGGALVSMAQAGDVIGILVAVPQIGGQAAQSVHIAVPIDVIVRKAAEAGFPIE